MRFVDTDVLVVGGGLAGMTAALSAEGRRVTLMSTWAPPAGTASAMAQGGIAAAVAEGDNPRLHELDTVRAGVNAGDPRAIRILCDEAAPAIQWLENMGASFDRDGDRRALHREAAHSRARVLHINQDRTGFALTRALMRMVRGRPNIECRSGYHAIALAGGAHGIAGVLALDRHGERVLIRAAETVLATGGLGQFFARTTNPRSACGDGLAMALAAGARCASLEFVQFHPTALAVGGDPLPLITEALRGAGAKLIDERGEEFMDRLHEAGALAPRDVVAREVWRQVRAGKAVHLDARELFARNPQAFPSVRNLCANHRVDPAKSPIPVTPAAHYHMGGVAVDVDGRTSLENLWACGEVACTGVHGANRLASNSLLEAVVFGRRLGRALMSANRGARGPVEVAANLDSERLSQEVDAALWSELRELMWTHVGIERDDAGLCEAQMRIQQMSMEAPAGQILLKNRLQLAEAVVAAARARKTSLGAHFRSDGAAAEAPSDADQYVAVGVRVQ